MIFKNKFIILMGKSACGKSTIEEMLVKKYGIKKYKTCTTRPKRDNEDNDSYSFLTQSEFSDKIKNNELLEYKMYEISPTVANDNEKIWYYGTPKKKFHFDFSRYVIVLTLEGAIDFVRHYGTKNCLLVYINCKDSIRRNRAKDRGNFDSAEWKRRKNADKEDFPNKICRKLSDMIIFSDTFSIDDACNEIINKIKEGKKFGKGKKKNKRLFDK